VFGAANAGDLRTRNGHLVWLIIVASQTRLEGMQN
jgi:hypothetical protein